MCVRENFLLALFLLPLIPLACASPDALIYKWSYLAGDIISHSSPAVYKGLVYFASYDGNLYALNATTGAWVWNFSTEFPTKIDSTPALSNDVVYFGASNKLFYALDARNGSLLWSRRLGGEVWASSPVLSQDSVFVGAHDGFLYALGAQNGSMRWKFKTGGPIDSSPLLYNNVVYFGSSDKSLYALNASTGEKLWSFETGDAIHSSSPALFKGAVYIGSYDKHVYAVHASNGTLKWKFATGGWIESSPAVSDDNVLYIGSTDRKVYALSALTGELVWNFTTSEIVFSSPLYDADTKLVFIGSDDNNIYALDALRGEVVWNYGTGDWVLGRPAFSGGVLYVASRDGRLYAFSSFSCKFTAPKEGSTVYGKETTIYGISDGIFPLERVEISLNGTGGPWKLVGGTARWAYLLKPITSTSYNVCCRTRDNNRTLEIPPYRCIVFSASQTVPPVKKATIDYPERVQPGEHFSIVFKDEEGKPIPDVLVIIPSLAFQEYSGSDGSVALSIQREGKVDATLVAQGYGLPKTISITVARELINYNTAAIAILGVIIAFIIFRRVILHH
ncbi:MAG: PQQ-binding-like beta-propeller repeat protein [Candidatus Micrarchaeota archaeon]